MDGECDESFAGTFVGKYFEVTYDESGGKVETVVDCTNIPTWNNNNGNVEENQSGFMRMCWPGGEKKQALVRFNPSNLTWEVQFLDEDAIII